MIPHAWSGTEHRTRASGYSLPTAPVTPLPEVSPRLLIGGQSEPGIDRAARLGDGLITLSNDHCQVYLDAVERHGGSTADARIYASQWAIVADDPERVWSQVGEHARYQLNKYIEWGSFEGPNQPSQFPDTQSILDAGAYRLMDASMAVDELVSLATTYPQIRDFHYGPNCPARPSNPDRRASSTWPTRSSPR